MKFIMLILSLVAAFANLEAVFVVNQPSAVVYETPEQRGHIEDIVRYGTQVTIEKEQQGWAYISYPGNQGWMKRCELLDVPAEVLKRANITVSFRNAYFFDEADMEWGPSLYLPFETKVELFEPSQEKYGRWVQVRLQDNRVGYIQSNQLAFSRSKLSLPEMVEFSKNFLGLNYLWGGTTGFGYDCSGFVQMLYRQAGIVLPRNSYQQAADPQFVDVTHPQAGDLVFFRNGKGRIVHVGMMINAQELIHSFTKEQAWVCISPLNDKRWEDGTFYFGYQIRRFHRF